MPSGGGKKTETNAVSEREAQWGGENHNWKRKKYYETIQSFASFSPFQFLCYNCCSLITRTTSSHCSLSFEGYRASFFLLLFLKLLSWGRKGRRVSPPPPPLLPPPPPPSPPHVCSVGGGGGRGEKEAPLPLDAISQQLATFGEREMQIFFAPLMID